MTRTKKIHFFLNTLRLDILLGGLASCWFMVFMAFYVEPDTMRNPVLSTLGLPISLLITFIIICCVSITAILLNNFLDWRYDQRFKNSRKQIHIPSIKINLLSCFLLILCAEICASLLGTAAWTGVTIICIAIIFYNLIGRFIASASVITLAVIYGIMMLIPDWKVGFAWPVTLVVTHIMVCACIRMSLTGSKTKLHHLDTVWIILAWLFLMMLLIALMRTYKQTAPLLLSSTNLVWLGPLSCVVLFIIITFFILKSRHITKRAKEKYFVALSNIWLIVYAMSWLFAMNLLWQGGVMAVLLLTAVCVPATINFLQDFSNRSVGYYKLDIDRPVKI